MDRDGKIIKTYQFKVAVGSILVLPPKQDKALITLAKAHKLAIIDLVSQEVSEIPFNFLKDNSFIEFMCTLYLFKESNLVCLHEFSLGYV